MKCSGDRGHVCSRMYKQEGTRDPEAAGFGGTGLLESITFLSLAHSVETPAGRDPGAGSGRLSVYPESLPLSWAG